ncbi:hypothetical protein [Lentibacillus daqui]|uniref:hypothetical protein n=1 Tax=Lentibacillus daqui TaxID=2911514 RepID=UPI0022B1FCAA|nr:hypothetical protein [Lentibacillus daqui]
MRVESSGKTVTIKTNHETVTFIVAGLQQAKTIYKSNGDRKMAGELEAYIDELTNGRELSEWDKERTL